MHVHDWVESLDTSNVLEISTSALASMRILTFHFSSQSSVWYVYVGLQERLTQLAYGDLNVSQNFYGRESRATPLSILAHHGRSFS